MSKATGLIIKHAALVARAGGIQTPCDRCALIIDVDIDEWKKNVCAVCSVCPLNKNTAAEETANKENEQ